MRGRHRGFASLSILIAVLLGVSLTGCAGLPTSGPVNAGQEITDDEDDGAVEFIPDGPTRDATPQQIIEGFIAAGSGPRDEWHTAQQFLTPAFRRVWNPRTSVTVYSPGQRTPQEVSEGEYTLTVTPVATVDATGAMSTPGDTGPIVLTFSLARQTDGQWRITKTGDGIVLDSNVFTRVYSSYALQFFDPGWTYLVPDQRWFPRLNAATSIAEQLVDGGPSAWLAGSVASAFTDGARLAQAAVPVRSGVAEVSLQEGARDLDGVALGRMQTQLQESLGAAGIVGVDMLVDENVLPADPVVPRATVVDSRPLVLTKEAFGFASGDVIDQIQGLSAAVLQTDATDIEVDAERSAAAVRSSSGAVLRVGDDGAILSLDGRPGLVAPSLDPEGYVWSVPADAPSDVRAFTRDGGSVAVDGAWPGAVRVVAQQVSRDGTRVAAVVRDGSRYALWVAGVRRDRDGAPTALGDKRVLATLPGPVTSLAWVDAMTVAAVTRDGAEAAVLTQEVGGFGTSLRAPDGAVAVAGGTQSGGMRVLDGDGDLFGERGANWQNLTSGVRVLAIQQGAPR